MKKLAGVSLLLLFLLIAIIASGQASTNEWSANAAMKWFNKKEWLNGARLKPHPSIDKKEFARQYHLNKTFWDKAFAFLKDHDLDSLPIGKYPIDEEENVIASVTEDSTRDIEKTNWESHRRFIDIQCIISGEEKMGISPVSESTVIKPYDEQKDLINYTATGKFFVAGAGTFFLFFPSEAHRPNITPGGNKVVKKIVVKVRAAA